MKSMGFKVLTLATVLIALAAQPTQAQAGTADSATISVRDGVYSAAQANRGRRVFGKACADCHQENQFAIPGYLRGWTGQTVDALFEFIQATMPEYHPGGLEREEYVDVLAYIFSLNGLPAGEMEMKSDAASLSRIRIESPSGGL
jgi:mono/diheme cytochrome c family protein